MQDASGQCRKNTAPAPGIARCAKSELEIGQGDDGGDGCGKLESGVTGSPQRGIRIEIGGGVRNEGVGQTLGDEDIAYGPGGGEGGAAAKDNRIGLPSGGLPGGESLGKGVEGADLLLVKGALAGCTGGGKRSPDAVTAAFERRQKGRNGGAKAGGKKEKGQGARIGPSGGVVAQASAKGASEDLGASS